jgi:hypothetical protein
VATFTDRIMIQLTVEREPDAPVERKIELLRLRDDALEQTVEVLKMNHDRKLDDLTGRLDGLEGEHRQFAERVEKDQAERERTAQTIGAIGLPIIGAGIVVTGLPDSLPRHPAF